MAERQPSRAQALPARKRGPKAGKPPAAAREERAAVAPASAEPGAARIATLEAERNRLRFELDTANERIALLERTHRDVLDRIASALKSLHSLGKD